MPIKFNSANLRSGGTVDFGALTVLIGPNNSGKSQVLRDCVSKTLGLSNSELKLFLDVNISMPTNCEMKECFNLRNIPNQPGSVGIYGIRQDLIQDSGSIGPKDWPDRLLNGGDEDILKTLGQFFVGHLNADTRFSLAADQDCYEVGVETPKHAIHEYFKNMESIQPKLRDAFKDAFGRDIALDFSSMKRWGFKVGDDFGTISDSVSEIGEKMCHGEKLKEQGDGYRSFTSIMMAALTFQNRPLLIDEPEAFLHPKQARILGRLLAQLSSTRAGQIVVSTHSSDFLWGVVSGNSEAHVLRLNRIGNDTTFIQVPAEVIKGLTQTPLLSSQPVLEALFHRGVVVCEGDPDRALYQAVAHKADLNGSGAELLFIHTNGKGAASVPIELLRQAGVPVCAVVDIDILNADDPLAKIVKALTGTEITQKLKSQRTSVANSVQGMSESELLLKLHEQVLCWQNENYSDVRDARRKLDSLVKEVRSGWDKVKKTGIECFAVGQRDTVQGLIDDLAQIGLFVVPCGELECWIKTGARKGKEWNRQALETIQKEHCPPKLLNFVSQLGKFLLSPKNRSEANEARTLTTGSDIQHSSS